MLNIIANKARRQYWREYNQGLINFERNMYRRIFASLKKQYRAAARNIEENQLNEIDWTIDDHNPEMYLIYVEEFQRLGAVYNEDVQDRVNQKAVDTVFWTFFFGWIRRYAAEKVVQISLTTKNILKRLIKLGEENGLSYREIGKDILEKTEILTMYRAAKISRTEVHTGTNTAIHESVRALGTIDEKEWLAAMDIRTRQEHMDADGERVGMNEMYMMTGEPMRYPGDPAGSAWNVIHCRCAELFHTRRLVA
jgi:hypothetical protein